MSAFLFCFAAWLAMALGMDKHHEDALGREASPTRLRHLRFRKELEQRAMSPETGSSSDGVREGDGSGIKISARRPASSGVVVSAGV